MHSSIVSQNKDSFLPTRGSLLVRLKNFDDHESWTDFFNTYWKLIHGVAIKSGLAEQEAQEVVQETLISVSKAIQEFEYQPEVCSFKTWLRTLIRRRIADQFRKRPREHLASGARPRIDADASSPILDNIPDPQSEATDTIWQEQWQKTIIDVALERLKRQISAEQYQIFYLHVVKQLPVREVAKTLGVSTGQIYLVKHRLSKSFQKTVKELQTKLV